MNGIDLLGFAAALCVIAAQAMRCMVRLRRLAIVANLLFLLYGALMQLWPMLFLHASLLALNLLRLREAERAG